MLNSVRGLTKPNGVNYFSQQRWYDLFWLGLFVGQQSDLPSRPIRRCPVRVYRRGTILMIPLILIIDLSMNGLQYSPSHTMSEMYLNTVQVKSIPPSFRI